MAVIPGNITINQNIYGNVDVQGGHVGIVLQVLKEDSEYLLALKPLGEAEWNAGISEITACLKGTREAVLKDIHDWLRSLDTPPIYWLTGSAGTGKSCISYTVCERYSEDGSLGATFFFSRDQDTRSKVDHVFRTLAHRLCINFPETIQPRILAALRKDATLFGPLPERHFRELVVASIRSISTSLLAPILVVIDALDECQWRHGKSAIAEFISLLAEELGDRATRLKVFITSRPENPTPIFSRRNVRVKKLADLVHQYDVEASIPQSDLNLYVSHEMTMLAEAYRTHWSPNSQRWPSDDDIQYVLRIAGSLFISAATVLRMLKAADKGATPHPHKILRRLRAALPETPAARPAAAASHDLDQLYRLVLQVAAQRHANEVDRQNIQRLLAFVVLSFYPLPVYDIGTLLGFTADALIPVLHPVLGTPGSEEPLRALHTSFHDFITNSQRCSEVDIRSISPSQSHLDLAIACLRQLKHLQRDLLSLGVVGYRNSNVADLVQAKITGSQEYAVRHWETHLSQCTMKETAEDNGVLNNLSAFIETSVLQYIEALSYLDILAEGRGSLEKIITLPIARQLNFRVKELIRDACRLMREHHIVISQGAMQVYSSALPFIPRQTQLSQSFSNAGSSIYPRVEGLFPSHWDACLQSIHLGGTIKVLEYSSDGRFIVAGIAGINSFKIQLLDASTGNLLLSLPVGSHSGSLALSPDDDRLVCSSGSTLKVFNCQSGKLLLESTIPGDKAEIIAASFSDDGESVVACSRDNILRSWDCTTGRELASIRLTKRDGYESAKLSRDGGKLIAWGARGLVLMDCRTGKKIRKYDTSEVTSAIFSPDGSRIAAGSHDNLIRVWNADSSKRLLKLKGHPSAVISLAFSQNNRFIVAGSRNWGRVQLWDGECGELLQTLHLPTGKPIMADVFSDGPGIISGSEHGLQVWDPMPRSGDHEAAIGKDVGDFVRCIAISQDGMRGVTGTYKSNVLKVWDMQTGKHQFDILELPSSPISITISWDGAVIVAWSMRGSIGMVWDGWTGTKRSSPKLESHFTREGLASSKGDRILVEDRGAAVTSDGSTFLCLDRCSNSVMLWDLDTGKARPLKLQDDLTSVIALATSRDGSYVACGDKHDRVVEVVDLRTGELACMLRGLESVASQIAISPDNEVVIASTLDRAGMAWELKTGNVLEPLCNALRHVQSLDLFIKQLLFLCGGKFVAAYVSHRKTFRVEIKIWNTYTGEEIPETKPRIHIPNDPPSPSETQANREYLVGPDRWIHVVHSDKRRYPVCYIPLSYGTIFSSSFKGDVGIVGFDAGRVLTFRMP